MERSANDFSVGQGVPRTNEEIPREQSRQRLTSQLHFRSKEAFNLIRIEDYDPGHREVYPGARQVSGDHRWGRSGADIVVGFFSARGCFFLHTAVDRLPAQKWGNADGQTINIFRGVIVVTLFHFTHNTTISHHLSSLVSAPDPVFLR